MTTLNPYLTFNGNCEEAFNFYRYVFGGDFQYVGQYKDMPEADRKNFPNEADKKIMHISLPISNETILMGCDSAETFGQEINFGNNISLAINTDSKVSADKIFNRVSVGGQVKMPMNETF